MELLKFINEIASIVFLPLADFKNKTEEEVIEHIVNEYSGNYTGFDEGEHPHYDPIHVRQVLLTMNILIAYESEGEYGCDSSSFFLLQKKSTGEYYTIQGSHCSCHGFEGQFDVVEIMPVTLHSMQFPFFIGGYDNDGDENYKLVQQYIEMYIPGCTTKLLN